MLHPQILQRKLLRIATKPQNLRKFSPPKVSRYTVYGLWYPSLGVILMVTTIHSSDDVLLQIVTYFECMNPVIAHAI